MWTLILAAEFLAIELQRPLELGADAVEITLVSPDDVDLRRQVSSIAADPAENLVLRLSSVEADGAPGVSWEVYLASSDDSDCDNVPSLVGIFSPYGVQPDAEFVFALDPALVVGEPVGVKVIFRPVSGLEEEGEPVPPTVRGTIRIGGISLETDRAVGR